MRRARLLTVLAIAALLVASPSPALATAHPRTSLTDIEDQVMCVECHESLAVAQSDQAASERDYIRQLINQGLDKQQIMKQLVAQYGPAVLGRPPANGFNLTVYVLPPAILLAGLAMLAIVLPRWRRRARPHGPADAAPSMTATDAKRLEQELAHFKG